LVMPCPPGVMNMKPPRVSGFVRSRW
jgi:hypothetical protein